MNLLDALTLQQLRALDALLELGSVTQAAQRLGVTQSAMSHTLRALRDGLDDPLLVRGGGGMVPTARAEALQVPLRRALLELEAALAPSGFDPATADRGFRLGMPDAFALLLVPELLRRVRSEAPGMDLDVAPVAAEAQAEALGSGALDLLVEVRPPAASGMRQRALFRDDFVCMVCAEAPIGKAFDLDTFCRLPHALISPSGTGSSVVGDALERVGRSRRVAVRVQSFLAAPSLVVGTDLVLTLPRRVALAVEASFPVRLLDPPLPLPSFTVHLVWHARVDADPAHQWLRSRVFEARPA